MSALGLPLALWYFKYTLSGSTCVISQIVQVRIVVSGSRFPSVSVIITHTRHKEQQWFLPGKEWNLSTYFYHTIRLCTRVVILTFSGTLKMIFSGTKHKQENRFLHTLVYFQWRPKHLLSFDIFSSRHSSGTAGFFFFLQGAVFTVFPFVWSIYFLVKTSSENKAWNNVLVPQWLTNRSFIFLEKSSQWWQEQHDERKVHRRLINADGHFSETMTLCSRYSIMIS